MLWLVLAVTELFLWWNMWNIAMSAGQFSLLNGAQGPGCFQIWEFYHLMVYLVYFGRDIIFEHSEQPVCRLQFSPYNIKISLECSMSVIHGLIHVNPKGLL